LGAAIGCGAHLIEMRRTDIGAVSADEAITPDDLQTAFEAGTVWEHAAPLDRFFEDWQRVVLADDQVARIVQGQPLRIQPREEHGPQLLAKDRAGRIVAVLVAAHPGSDFWRPAKVLRATG
jgi:tRNA pseudouridine55 synthase